MSWEFVKYVGPKLHELSLLNMEAGLKSGNQEFGT